MSPRLALFRRAAAAALALAGLAALPCQSPTAALADALVRAQAPSADDPDASVRDLVTTALAHRRSPAAHTLVDEALRIADRAQQPRELRAWLRRLPTAEPTHGRLAQRLRELIWQLDCAIDGYDPTGPVAPAGYLHTVVAAGPFGDGGDHFVGVPFAPELQFPAIGAELPGRGRRARASVVVNHPFNDYVELDRNDPGKEGCWYGLMRVAVDAALDTFLEVEVPGDHQVFVDETEVLRVERWRGTSNRHAFVALRLPAGEHTVLLKAATNGQCRVTARFVDAEGHAEAAVRPVPITDSTLPPTGERATLRPDRFVTASELWTRAATADDAPAPVRIAALLQALHDGHGDLALRLTHELRLRAPADALDALAFANVLRRAPLPEETRKADARKLVERAAPMLGDDHHAARLARAQLLEEQDQREAALRLLAAHPQAGPATWERRYALLRQLRFRAEAEPTLAAWAAACPGDTRPLTLRADLAANAGDSARALALRLQALALRLDRSDTAQAAFRDALDTADFATAERLLGALVPLGDQPPSFSRLWLQYELAMARGDAAAAVAHLQAVANHAETPAQWQDELADAWLQRGERERAAACLARSLELDPDQPALRDWHADLLGAGDASPLATFRRDGAAAVAAFRPGDAERGASTTVVIDQRILDVQPDGSWTSEVHALHRVNDQAGVEAFSGGIGIDDDDEVLLVQTIGADGERYVPSRIDDDYSMPQLQPGAFVEWRVRSRGDAPGADALATEAFFFGDPQSPSTVAELVVALPTSGRGELRTRALGEPTETRTLADGRQALVFRREQVPALAKERFLPTLFEMLPCAELGEDPAPFAEQRSRRLGLLARSRPTAPIAAKAQELVAGAADARARATAIWSWCQREIDKGPSRDALETLLRGKGDRFLLMVALLRGADVPVVPMIAKSEREELGEGEQSLFTTDDAFGATGVAALLPDGERLLLFADTPRHWPLGAVPAQRGGAPALLLHDDRTEPILLPIGGHAQSLRIRGKATLRSKDLRLEVEAELGDVQGFALAEQLREQKDNVQKLAARQIAQQVFAGFRIEGASLQLDATGAPLRVRATLLRSGVQRNGDRLVVPLPLPESRYAASYGDRAARTLPFRLSIDRCDDWEIELTLGDDVRVASLPPAVAVTRPPLAFTQECTLQGQLLTIRRQAVVGAGSLPAIAWPEWLRALAAADRAEKATIELTSRQ